MTLATDLSSAKAYALRLIKFRPRSEKEIVDKLKNKGYGSETIEELIAYLKKTRLLDDALFAKLWVEGRVKRFLGLARLRYELKQKGIEPEIIESVLGGLAEDYNEEKIVEEIVIRKIKKMEGIAPEKIKSRLYGFLIRRGYPKHAVIEALLKYVPRETDNET